MLNIIKQYFLIYILGMSLLLIILHFTGVALKLYKKTKCFDIIVHFLSGCLLFTPLGFWLAYKCPNQPLWIATLFAFCFGGSISALWEIIEFTIDSILKSNLQQWKDNTKFSIRGSGVIDIMGDIIANFSGSLIACLIIMLLILFI